MPDKKMTLEDQDAIIALQVKGMSLEDAIYNVGYEKGHTKQGPVWVKASIVKVLAWAEKFYSEKGDQLMLDDNEWYITTESDKEIGTRNCKTVTAEELADLYLMHHPDEQPAAGREEAVEFTPDDTAFMIDCDLHPTYNGITIQTENDEGASLSVDDITRLSDVLRRYAILFKLQKEK